MRRTTTIMVLGWVGILVSACGPSAGSPLKSAHQLEAPPPPPPKRSTAPAAELIPIAKGLLESQASSPEETERQDRALRDLWPLDRGAAIEILREIPDSRIDQDLAGHLRFFVEKRFRCHAFAKDPDGLKEDYRKHRVESSSTSYLEMAGGEFMDCENERDKGVNPILDEPMFIVLAEAFARTEKLLTATTIPVPVLRRLPAASSTGKNAMRRLVDSLREMMQAWVALQMKETEVRLKQRGRPLPTAPGSSEAYAWAATQLGALNVFRAHLE